MSEADGPKNMRVMQAVSMPCPALIAWLSQKLMMVVFVVVWCNEKGEFMGQVDDKQWEAGCFIMAI